MKHIASILAVLIMSACAAAEITTPPIMVTAKSPGAASGIDVYARDRARGNPVPAFRGQKTVQIRSTGKAADGSIGELSGVGCSLDSGVFVARQLSKPIVIHIADPLSANHFLGNDAAV